MGASDRLGGNGPLPIHRLCRAADTSALLNLDAEQIGEAAKRSAERAENGIHVPPEEGFEGNRGSPLVIASAKLLLGQ